MVVGLKKWHAVQRDRLSLGGKLKMQGLRDVTSGQGQGCLRNAL